MLSPVESTPFTCPQTCLPGGTTVCPVTFNRSLPASESAGCQDVSTKGSKMPVAAAETKSLVAFMLPGSPYSVQMARFYIRAALSYHQLGGYAEDAETVASELITNAITHTGAPAVGLELTCLISSGALAIVVTDPCPLPPVRHYPGTSTEHGRGLHVVEALSARWGWRPKPPGKAVYAILVGEA
jgi:anti-sigma regulatory factor (Ser/Thr protein kinase)